MTTSINLKMPISEDRKVNHRQERCLDAAGQRYFIKTEFAPHDLHAPRIGHLALSQFRSDTPSPLTEAVDLTSYDDSSTTMTETDDSAPFAFETSRKSRSIDRPGPKSCIKKEFAPQKPAGSETKTLKVAPALKLSDLDSPRDALSIDDISLTKIAVKPLHSYMGI